jgi:hypothetical protein
LLANADKTRDEFFSTGMSSHHLSILSRVQHELLLAHEVARRAPPP